MKHQGPLFEVSNFPWPRFPKLQFVTCLVFNNMSNDCASGSAQKQAPRCATCKAGSICIWFYMSFLYMTVPLPFCFGLYLLAGAVLYLVKPDCTWVNLALPGFLWLYMAVAHDCSRLFMAVAHGCSWLCLAVTSCVSCLVLHGCTWMYLIATQVNDMWIYTTAVTDGVIKDTCKGDSGGPLVVDNGGQPLLIGVLKVNICRGLWATLKDNLVYPVMKFPGRYY